MLTDDIPEVIFDTEAGDMVWVPYTGRSLRTILRLARRKGWDYRPEPHGFGTLLHCTTSPLGGKNERVTRT
jgi:hypothetical protein